MNQNLIDDGVYYGISREQYDACERANFSSLKYFEKSPKHYRHNKAEQKRTAKEKPSDYLLIGNALHIKTFEPAEFERRVIKWDGGTRRGKDWDKFAALYPDRIILTEKGWDAVQGMGQAIHEADEARQYLVGGAGEMTILFTLETSDGEPVKMKMRLDFDCNLALVDLKSSSFYQPVPFGFQAENLHYDAQSALYTDGYRQIVGGEKPYKLIAVESAAPHDVVVYDVGKTSLMNGREKYQRWIDALALHTRLNHWPGVSGGVELELFVPGQNDTEEQETLATLTQGGSPLHLERD